MKADMKGHLGSTDDTNGEERRDIITMEEFWTAESTWEPQGEEAATRQEHTRDT
ncbi:hypothetical protein T03_1075 [Trichinella britovi]|uniref:Uncharacterized protein n=1 Tax=Trichinella britovi TaxID=45882 RepID=A0A0V1AZ40_TRIBR|nr:hypothetical protein T03_1075 [Trichinella britovi]